MSKNFKRYTITSALPYANGPIHLGHLAGAYLPADIFVRYHRLKKSDIILAGQGYGRVKILRDSYGRTIKKANGSMSVEITGLDVVPHAGDRFYCLGDINRAKAVAEENVNILVLSDGQIHLLPSYHERLVNMALTIDHIDVTSDWSMGKFDDFIALYNGDPSKAKKIVSTVKYKQKDKGVSQFKRGKGEMFRKTIFYDVLLGNHASVIEALKGDGVQLVKVYLPRALGNHRHDLSSLLALSLLESGQEEKAHALLKRRINALMRALNSGIEIPFLYYDLACAYSVLGETDEAFHYLERAVKGGFLPWYMKHDPRLKKLLALSEMQKINVLVSVRLSEELLLGDDYAFTSSQIQEQAQLLIEH